MKMSFSSDHGSWDAGNVCQFWVICLRGINVKFWLKGGEYPGYPNEINGYGGLWDPHHFSGQNPALSGYPDILTAFNSDLGKFKHFVSF